MHRAFAQRPTRPRVVRVLRVEDAFMWLAYRTWVDGAGRPATGPPPPPDVTPKIPPDTPPDTPKYQTAKAMRFSHGTKLYIYI